MRQGHGITIWLVAATVVLGIPCLAAAAPEVVSKDVSSAKEVHDYWTQKRLREAQPADGFALAAPSPMFRFAPSTPPAPQGPPQVVASTDSSAPALRDGAVTIDDTTPEGIRTHGRIFFKMGKRTFACSGTVVSSENESTVWTAAHCLSKQKPSSFVKNLVFLPAYDEGPSRFGIWPAEELHVTKKWIKDGPESSDFGSALMETKPAQKDCSGLATPQKRQCKNKNRSATTIQDEVGSRGIAFNQPVNQTWTAYGYPLSPQPRFDGEHLEACTSKLKRTDPLQGSPKPIGIDCDMEGGASGGGWVINGDTVNGIVAYRYPDREKDTVYSPYFGNAVKELYNRVQDCPLAGCK